MRRREPASHLDVDVLIPARDEERTLLQVVRAMPARLVRSVVVIDNGSTDATARVAEDAGAVVVREQHVGFGSACLRGIAHLGSLPEPPDIVVFCTADGSYDPGEIPSLVEPLRDNLFDLVVGSRVLGNARLASGPTAGNLVAVNLIRAIYGHRYTDLGPFRAIRYPALVALGMRDAGHGWLVEMQVKALRVGLRIAEAPVSYRPRAPRAGVAGQVRSTLGTSAKTIFHIVRHSTAR